MKTDSVIALAYLGDAVYELSIRSYLLKQGLVKGKDLQKAATSYVSAKSQEEMLMTLLDQAHLTTEEQDLIRRARNHKHTHKPKYTKVITYKHATALEALFGYLYQIGSQDRIEQLIKIIIGE